MKQRNPVAVVLLTLVTFGIYGLVWFVKTTREMRSQGAEIPNCFLIIIPFVSWYWLWKYSEGVEKVTNGKSSKGLVFLLFFLLGFVGQIVAQLAFNEVSASPSSTTSPLPDEGVSSPAAPSTSNATAPSPGVTAAATAATVAPVAASQASSDQPSEVAQQVIEPTPVTPPTAEEPATQVAAAPPNPVVAPEIPVTIEPVVAPDPNAQSPQDGLSQPQDTPTSDGVPPVVTGPSDNTQNQA